jgi:hypothetical protein
MDELRCRDCGERIGLYEPLVALVEGQAQETSRTADPRIAETHACYHRSCFERVHDANAPSP